MRVLTALPLIISALALSACEDPETVAAMEAEQQAQLAATQEMPSADGQFKVAQVGRVPSQTPESGSIDWEAARAARTASPVNDAQIQVQSVTGAGSEPQVPILLPSGIVQTQNTRPPTMVQTEDGYFATYQTVRYDAIVNGTKNSYATSGERATRNGEMTFTESAGSAQLAFSRFGADYLIEFECRQVDNGDSCITEQEARDFAESLFVAQTQ